MARATTTLAKGAGRTITFEDRDDWGSGFIGAVTIGNTSDTAAIGWTIEFDLANAITNIWNAEIVSHVGTHYVIRNLSYDATIAAGGSVSFGFQASGGSPALPTSFVLNGTTIGGATTPPPPPPPPPPLPTIAIADASVDETGAATLSETFTVTLSSVSTTPVTVRFHTVDGTAHAGSDYDARSGTLTFAAGQTTQTVTIATHPGATGRSAFTVVLDTPSGATLADASATGTIVNPPPVVPTISVAGATVDESGGGTGSTLLPAGFLSTRGNQIVDSQGHAVKIAAVNWYGMETSLFAPQGLWTQNYQSMMRQMAELGFNAIRLPFSLQAFEAGSTPNGIDYGKNPDLKGLSALQILDKIVTYAGQIGLKIILDDHRSAAGSGPNGDGLWYDGGYTEAQWISTWKMLATHYAGNGTVVGADLLNEPHGSATWGDGSATDWAAAATRAGNAIQSVNPDWLILVEGIDTYQGNSTWWGGNLMGAKDHPITLNVANKLVYSPHDYPASVYPQSWFSAADYPNNLPAVWDKYWGYLYETGAAPVLVGEFGSKLQTASDQAWIAKLVDYMNHPGGVGGEGAQCGRQVAGVRRQDLGPQPGVACRHPRGVVQTAAPEGDRLPRRCDQLRGQQRGDDMRQVRDGRERGVVIVRRHLDRDRAAGDRQSTDVVDRVGQRRWSRGQHPRPANEEITVRSGRPGPLTTGDRMAADVAGQVDA